MRCSSELSDKLETRSNGLANGRKVSGMDGHRFEVTGGGNEVYNEYPPNP